MKETKLLRKLSEFLCVKEEDIPRTLQRFKAEIKEAGHK
jgi:hypothetical protein